MTAKVVKSETLHQGKVFDLLRDTIRLDSGLTTEIDIIRHPGASAIVPFLDDNTLILIRQYRHALGDYIWEIPAGTLNPGETPAMCARRELTEETGYVSHEWHELGEIVPVPGYSNERIHMFLATELMQSDQNLDDDEMLTVHTCKFDDALAFVNTGKIKDGKTICGLFMAMKWLSDK
jgi:8-oxo-dGTP pyrophosphatase MutT (NUDIX family)